MESGALSAAGRLSVVGCRNGARHDIAHRCRARQEKLLRLSSDGGLLDQIASGQWDQRIDASGREDALVDLLVAIGERARVDRIVLDALVTLRS